MKVYFIFLSLFSIVFAQQESLTLSGRVIDEHDSEALELVTIVLNKNKIVTYTDEQGQFKFQQLVPGEYHLQLFHLACETKNFFIQLRKDTSVLLYLEHHEELLQTITIHKYKESLQKSTAKVEIKGDDLERKQGGSLGDILKSIAGVNSLQTGGGISKPIIHGLFGNRIQIMNNGVSIEGQQWGNEHAPEIDPFTVQKITIVKGSSTLKYGTRAMGGVVLLDNQDMPKENHLHGSLSLVGFSNGLKGASSLNLEGGFKENTWFKWRTQVSFSKSGDNRAAGYYLSNTARQELAGNVQLQFKREQFKTLINWSIYQYQLGILRGSHIGNLTDLEEAFTRPTPFFTDNTISYAINKPNQNILHNTLNVDHTQHLQHGDLNLNYNFQYNKRQEFDVRRSSDRASLYLNLQSQQALLSYQNNYKSLKYTVGTQFQNKLNFNDHNLNVKPLIPNYRTNMLSFFSIQELQLKNIVVDFGARYEYQNMLVRFYENNTLYTSRHLFNNYAFSSGIFYQSKFGFSSRTSISLINRSPEINELYSSGLHHGAASIENGNSTFKNERMWSLNQTFTYNKGEQFSIEFTPYYQYFYNYIQLVPKEELQLTIRGSFPVFNYENTKASIWGFDIGMRTQVYKQLFWKMQSAIVRGANLESHSSLSFIPADYLQNGLSYALAFQGKMKELNFGINLRNVVKQTRVPAFDFVAAPQGYHLLGAELSGKIQLNKLTMNWQIEATNLLNTSYRDYLNRWRYYADDLGINLVFRTKFIF